MRQFQRNLFRAKFHIRSHGLEFGGDPVNFFVVLPWDGNDDLVDPVVPYENEQIVNIALYRVFRYFPGHVGLSVGEHADDGGI